MAVTYNCDRCRHELSSAEVRLTVRQYPEPEIVLCNRCLLDFHDWVKRGNAPKGGLWK